MKVINKTIILATLSLSIVLNSCFLEVDEVNTVTYQVTGDAEQVDIIIRHQGGSSQFSSVSLPWEYSFDMDTESDSSGCLQLYVAATNSDTSSKITSLILYKEYSDDDLTTLAKSSSEGSNVTAAAEYWFDWGSAECDSDT